MREAWCTDTGTVAHGAAVTGQVVAVDPFRCFNHLERFLRRHDRPPRHLQEVRDQGLDVLQCALFRWRRGQWVIRLERAFRHIFVTLFQNTQALTQFFYFEHDAGITVTDAITGRHFKVKVFVARVWTPFTHIERDPRCAQASTGGAPGQCVVCVVSSHAFGTANQNGVFQRCFDIGIQTSWHPVKELTQETIPAFRQIMRYATNTEPGRVHTETGNRFHQIVDFLTIGKGEEHRSHRAHVLNKRRDVQQMAVDTEQFGQHDANGVNAIRRYDTGEFFNSQHVWHFVYTTAEVFDTVGVRNVAVPGLALAHFLSTTVVVTDVRHAVDNLFAIKLQNDTECTVRRRMVRTEVEEHEVLIFGATLHAPVFRLEGQRLHLEFFFL